MKGTKNSVSYIHNHTSYAEASKSFYIGFGIPKEDLGRLTVGMKWDKGALYIGRGSPLGNPFKMENQSEKERTRVLRLYEVWLKGQINKNNYEVMVELNRIADLLNDGVDIHFGCFCKPKRCHGDIIKKILLRMTHDDMDYLPF